MKNIKIKLIDPTKAGVSKRIKVGIDTQANYYIVKSVKSRIIMKDGRRLLDQIRQIKKVSNKEVLIFTTAPVCSKTKSFLNSNGVEITQENNTEKMLKKDENRGSLNIRKT